VTARSLGDVARFVNGFPFKPSDWGREGLPIIRIQNLTGTKDDFNYTTREVKSELIVEPGDLLVSWSATLDVYRWGGPRGLLNQHIFKVFPYSGIDPDYLYFALKNVIGELTHKTHGSTMKHVVRGDFESTNVRVPSIAEQRQIVDILSRAEGIIRLQRQATEKAREIVPALFLNMFGDPVTNPKGWPATSLGDQVEIASVVRTPNLRAEAEMLCVGPDSIASYTGQIVSRPLVREVKPKSGKYRFAAGEVLYSKIRPYLAKAALADTEGYCSADMYPLRCKENIRSFFLCSLLLSRAFTSFASAESVRAQMPKLNRETLFAYRFPLPPFDLQGRFAHRAAEVRSVQVQQETAARKAESVFNALLARSFAQG